jgi:hypothetical protein
MTEDAELDAMQKVLSALISLEAATRARVISWVTSRFEITVIGEGRLKTGHSASLNTTDDATGSRLDNSPPDRQRTLAELFAAANPRTGGEKALVVGYWKHEREQASSFESQAINTELKHMGHRVPNITVAMDELQRQKPQLAVQLRKAGTTKQARKTYKITTEGIKYVEAMLKGERDPNE